MYMYIHYNIQYIRKKRDKRLARSEGSTRPTGFPANPGQNMYRETYCTLYEPYRIWYGMYLGLAWVGERDYEGGKEWLCL
jgi:hypothetical protein